MFAVIKSQEQYDAVLRRVDELLSLERAASSDEQNELEVLAVLLRDYEHRESPLLPPDPIVAIRVRAEQKGLLPRDLVPFFGTRSRVSEVLSGKRPLTLSMIRALHEGLGIPLEALVAEPRQPEAHDEEVEWDRFPIREMARRGWLNVARVTGRAKVSYGAAKDALSEFFGSQERLSACFGSLQKTDNVRSGSRVDRYSLVAWTAHVLRRAERVDPVRRFDPADWDDETLRDLRSLSRFEVGPRLAVQFLEERGIIVDVVPHLPRTRLDGAAMLREDGTPVIALTIRHDRLDNFWFTLFHELMHVVHHLARSGSCWQNRSGIFLDDLDVVASISDIEKEADTRAREALIPERLWEGSAVRFVVAPLTVTELAREASVSEAVVAGRVRFEKQNYRLLSQMVGAGEVRAQFPEVNWQQSEA